MSQINKRKLLTFVETRIRGEKIARSFVQSYINLAKNLFTSILTREGKNAKIFKMASSDANSHIFHLNIVNQSCIVLTVGCHLVTIPGHVKKNNKWHEVVRLKAKLFFDIYRKINFRFVKVCKLGISAEIIRRQKNELKRCRRCLCWGKFYLLTKKNCVNSSSVAFRCISRKSNGVTKNVR